MVDAALLDYVKAQLQRGYSAQQLSTFLIQQGYRQEDVSACFREIYATPAEPHTPHKSVLPLLILGLVILGAIGYVGYVLFIPTSQDVGERVPAVSLTISMDKGTFSQGEAIALQQVLHSDVSNRALPVQVTYVVRDTVGNDIYTARESVMLQGNSEESVRFTPPELAEGRYRIEATVQYLDRTTTAGSTFFIAGGMSDIPVSPDPTDDSLNDSIEQCPVMYEGDRCTVARCGPDTDFQVVYEDIVPCCGNAICEPGETTESCPEDCADPGDQSYFNRTPTQPTLSVLDENIPLTDQIRNIRSVANQDFNDAASFCDAIIFPYYRDDCFYQIVEETLNDQGCQFIEDERTIDRCYTRISRDTGDVTLCASIISDLRRDSCYMRFALQGDYTVCELLVDSYYIQSCEQLREIGSNVPEELR